MSEQSAGVARQEILDAIAFYPERGWDWLDIVAYLGIRHAFGSWNELARSFYRKGVGRPRAAQ